MFRSAYAFRTRQQPYMVRHSYRHEVRSALTFPLAAALAEGSFTSIVAAKYFEAHIILISVIAAAPMFGNIMALYWSELSLGRRKVPMVNLLQGGVVLLIASVALTYFLPMGLAGWIFAGQIILTRMLASGIITIRSAIWRANYPRQFRGQITSRIAVVASGVLAVTTFTGAYLLDLDPVNYVYLYPGAALLGLLGIWQFSRIRVRREVLLRRREEQLYAPRPESMAQTDEANVMNYNPAPPRGGILRFFGQAWQVLRDDPDFRQYQRWQFVSGFAFMLFTPPLFYMVSTEMTNPARDYLLATIILQIVPMLMVLVCTPLWAPIFDRVHVTRFRVYQGYISVAAMLTLFTGAMLAGPAVAGGAGRQDLPVAGLLVVTLGTLLMGLSNAGGALAWNLGHNAFTTADKAATYMGVHVMLTGLRGCLAPFLGAGLYLAPFIGRGVFLISLTLSVIALFGWIGMARRFPPPQASPARRERRG